MEFANEFYSKQGINVGRGKSIEAIEGKKILEETRSMLAEHFKTDFPDRVIFSPSASIALNQLIFGLRHLNNIYFTPFEHNSILRPIYELKQKNPLINLIEIPIEKNTYTIDWDGFEKRLDQFPPDLICITQTSNVTGFQPPIEEIVGFSREYQPDTRVIVDGAQAAGLQPIEIQKAEVDFYVFSGHKSFLAGYGIAGWVMSKEGSKKLFPFLFGGTGTFSEQLIMPDTLPSKFEVGSMNMWAIAALFSSLKWIKEQKVDVLSEKTKNLGIRLKEGLKEVDGIKIHSPELDKWYPIISFTYKNVNSNIIGDLISKGGVANRSGFHCAPLAHQWIGSEKQGGTIRLSPGPFNTENEIELALSTIKKTLEEVS